MPAWLLIAGATWCIARALLPDPPLLRLGIATTLSWTAGFAAVPVPAGAGVREAVFLAASGLDVGIGATVAVGSRLAFLVVDVAGAVLTSPWHRRSRATAPPRPAEPVATGDAAEPAAAGEAGSSGGPDGPGDAVDEGCRPDGSGDPSSSGDPGVHGGPGRIVASGRPDREP